MPNNNFNEEKAWSTSWVKHMESYLAAPPRCGIWLKSRFHLRTMNVLECAGGSCRDARFLHNSGVSAAGSDFDGQTLRYLKQRFVDSSMQLTECNAFEMPFENKSYELVFHNGFWIYFSDNKDIFRLFAEQARVSKKFAVILVHNSENKRLVKSFAKKQQHDNLYDIRFFDPKEFSNILRDSNVLHKSFLIEKFGGPADMLYLIEKRFAFAGPFLRWLVPRLYRFQPWSTVERVACIVEVE